MGFFSFKTQDTDRSIANHYSNITPFTVYMTDNQGNIWKEDNYSGYGEFGGKDYYELLSEMNGLGSDRDAGIDLFFNKRGEKYITPNLSESPNWEWVKEVPEDCEFQGYFYGLGFDDDEEEGDDW
jgi:hypothetical protein